MDLRSWLSALLLVGLALSTLGCAASHHPAEPSSLGVVSSSDELLSQLAVPGPIHFEKVIAADWVVDRAGLINLDHPAAAEAGLVSGPEPIQIYFYVIEHPTFGTFIVDSGVERAFTEPGGSDRVGFLVGKVLGVDALKVRIATGDWISDLEQRGGRLAGVFLTHIHSDHVMGLPDIPREVPVYAGPGEPEASAFLNLFTRGTIDALLSESGPLQEWAFEDDAGERFAGVLDVFGDGSMYALHVPGHSPGSTAFVVRTTEGPKLLAGDASHTAWGWEHSVEPGWFSHDQPGSVESLRALRELVAIAPELEVHLGHQSLESDEAVAVR